MGTTSGGFKVPTLSLPRPDLRSGVRSGGEGRESVGGERHTSEKHGHHLDLFYRSEGFGLPVP